MAIFVQEMLSEEEEASASRPRAVSGLAASRWSAPAGMSPGWPRPAGPLCAPCGNPIDPDGHSRPATATPRQPSCTDERAGRFAPGRPPAKG